MENQDILESNGFEEAPQFIPWQLWLKRSARMAFSWEAMRDADAPWLTDEAKAGSTDPRLFVFYCGYGAEMDPDWCQSMLGQIGLGNLKAEVRRITPAR